MSKIEYSWDMTMDYIMGLKAIIWEKSILWWSKHWKLKIIRVSLINSNIYEVNFNILQLALIVIYLKCIRYLRSSHCYMFMLFQFIDLNQIEYLIKFQMKKHNVLQELLRGWLTNDNKYRWFRGIHSSSWNKIITIESKKKIFRC